MASASISFENANTSSVNRGTAKSDLHLPAPSFVETTPRTKHSVRPHSSICYSGISSSTLQYLSTMTSSMDWEAPIPVWIESINIDMDEELPVSDLMTPSTPGSTKIDSFITSWTSEQPSLFDTLLEEKSDIILDVQDIKVVESPIKTKGSSPNISPAKSKPTAKPTAKPARRPRRKVDVDPVGGERHRKDKQRGYEKGYRSRKKTQSLSDKAEWIQLETQIRQILTKRTSVLVLGPLDERRSESSTVSIRQRYLELLQEERALRESEAFDSCFFAEHQAMLFWGGATKSSRDIREQMNGLSSLRECQMFEFSW